MTKVSLADLSIARYWEVNMQKIIILMAMFILVSGLAVCMLLTMIDNYKKQNRR